MLCRAQYLPVFMDQAHGPRTQWNYEIAGTVTNRRWHGDWRGCLHRLHAKPRTRFFVLFRSCLSPGCIEKTHTLLIDMVMKTSTQLYFPAYTSSSFALTPHDYPPLAEAARKRSARTTSTPLTRLWRKPPFRCDTLTLPNEIQLLTSIAVTGLPHAISLAV